jgi:hypothetical protein
VTKTTFHEFQTEVYNVTKKRDDVRDELRKALQTLVANDVDLIICEVTSKLIMLYDYFTKKLNICEVTSKLITLSLFHQKTLNHLPSKVNLTELSHKLNHFQSKTYIIHVNNTLTLLIICKIRSTYQILKGTKKFLPNYPPKPIVPRPDIVVHHFTTQSCCVANLNYDETFPFIFYHPNGKRPHGMSINNKNMFLTNCTIGFED